MSRTAKDFEVVLSSFEKSLPLTIGAVISIYKDVKKEQEVANFIISLTDKTVSVRDKKLLMRKLYRVIHKFKSFKYNFCWFWDDMINFVNRTFDLPPTFHSANISISPTPIPPTISTVPDSLTRQQCTQCKILQSSMNIYKNKIKHLKKVCTVGDFYNKYDFKRAVTRKQETINRLKKKNEILNRKLAKLRRQHREVPKKRTYKRQNTLSSLRCDIKKMRTQYNTH